MYATDHPTTLPAEGFVRRQTVEAVTATRRAWIYDQIKRGRFPAPVKVGRASLWEVGSLRAWLADPAGWRSATSATAGAEQ